MFSATEREQIRQTALQQQIAQQQAKQIVCYWLTKDAA